MIRLELLCSLEDREGVIEVLRSIQGDGGRLIEIEAGLHPRSLDDAPIHERVTGRIACVMLLLEIDGDRQRDVMDALSDLHLRRPLRWTCQPIAESGVLGR